MKPLPIVFLADNGTHLVITVPSVTKYRLRLALLGEIDPLSDLLCQLENHSGDVTVLFTSKPTEKIEVIE